MSDGEPRPLSLWEKIRERDLAVLLACAALFALSCSRQHSGPEVGDSVTNWLHACSRDSECHGDAVCVNALCSVPCSPNASAGNSCGALSSSASCDTSAQRCDLSCETSSACRDLGAGFSCVEGRCRTQESTTSAGGSGNAPSAPSSAGSGTPVEAPTLIELALKREQDDVRSTLVSSAPEYSTFDMSKPFLLGEQRPPATGIGAYWADDHWGVMWEAESSGGAGDQAWGFARLYRDGRLERQTKILPGHIKARVATHYSGDGRVVFVGAADSCGVEVRDLEADISYPTANFQCTDWMISAAPIAESDDWMLTWGEPVTEQGASPAALAIVARYNPDSSAWVGGPWRIATENMLPAIARDATGAWLWSMGTSGDGMIARIYRFDDSDTAAPRVTAFPGVAPEVRSAVALADGMMMFAIRTGQTQATLSATSVGASGTGTTRLLLAESSLGEYRALSIPELGQVAVCLASSSGLQLLFLDQQANVISGPTLLDMDAGVAECAIAWSGTELLAVWTMKSGTVPSAETTPVRTMFVTPPGVSR